MEVLPGRDESKDATQKNLESFSDVDSKISLGDDEIRKNRQCYW